MALFFWKGGKQDIFWNPEAKTIQHGSPKVERGLSAWYMRESQEGKNRREER